MWLILRESFKAHSPSMIRIPFPQSMALASAVPGNQSDSFSKSELEAWRIDFYRRLRNHLKRVCKQEHDEPDVGEWGSSED